MVALKNFQPSQASQLRALPPQRPPAQARQAGSRQHYKQHNIQIYALVWGFSFYLLTTTAYSLMLGKLEPIYFMGLIAISLMMVINAFGEQLGLSPWFRIVFSFAMGWLVPSFMSGMYFFQNHIAF